MTTAPIVHVITSLDVGGAQTALARLLARLDRNEFPSEVVSLRPLGRIADRVRDLGIPVSSLDMTLGPGALGGFLRLAREFHRIRPRLVQTWMYHADLIGGLAARRAGVPVLWNLRQSTLDARGTKPTTRAIAALCARLSTRIPVRIVCASHAGKTAHVALGYDARRIVVIPNGIDLETFRPDAGARAALRAELGLAADAPLVALVARFDPQKDHQTFFAAASRLLRCRADVHFVLCGEGIEPTNAELARAIRTAGVEAAVHLLGARLDVERVVAGVDLATSTSAFGEGFPNAVAEAMACGVPCVATDSGDGAEIIGDCGEVVPPRDSDALANAWQRWLDMDVAVRADVGRRARERIRERFDVARMIERYAELYGSAGASAC